MREMREFLLEGTTPKAYESCKVITQHGLRPTTFGNAVQLMSPVLEIEANVATTLDPTLPAKALLTEYTSEDEATAAGAIVACLPGNMKTETLRAFEGPIDQAEFLDNVKKVLTATR